MSGRPGPVLVDIPKDVQTALIDVENLPSPPVRAGLPAIDRRGQAAAQMIDEPRNRCSISAVA